MDDSSGVGCHGVGGYRNGPDCCATAGEEHRKAATNPGRPSPAGAGRGESKLERAAYHEFLDVDRAFQSLAISGQLIDRSIYAKWQERFDHAYNALQLFGTVEVRGQASDFADLFPRQLRVPKREGRSEEKWAKDYSRGIKECYFGLLPDIKQRRASLVTAMRGDVAPQTTQRET